jgi:phosphopantothenoylcysteine synthetase/decarboxylase
VSEPVLYVIACAAPPARHVGTLIAAARHAGWTTCLLVTPSAVRFLDATALAGQTGYPVRSEYKNPGDPDVLPDPDAIIVAPATVNTIDKWAAGICDTLALGILVEGIGRRLPIVAVPWSNAAPAAHPAFVENIGKLRSWGVQVLHGPDRYPDSPGDEQMEGFPWQQALAELGPARRSSA